MWNSDNPRPTWNCKNEDKKRERTKNEWRPKWNKNRQGTRVIATTDGQIDQIWDSLTNAMLQEDDIEKGIMIGQK